MRTDVALGYLLNIYCVLDNGDRFYLNPCFTQFLICNNIEFPRLFDRIKEIVTKNIDY